MKKQVIEGNQSKPFEGEDSLCCGQFIGLPNRTQRGIHGTAAALMVLARSEDPPYNCEVKKLVNYIENRTEIELEKHGYSPENLGHDEHNIIKISESLFALSFIKAGAASTDELKNKLQKKLNDSRIKGKGWAYFINSKEEAEILPTAYAILGLYNNGFIKKDDIAIDFLYDKIMEYKKTEISDPSIFSIIILGLYALTVLERKKEKEEKEIKLLIKKLWKSQFCYMENDIEQNIEYWRETEHFYMRIPWQLYLLSITCRLYPRYFSTVSASKRIISIIKSGKSKGFKYPFSGPNLSARTNAILFEILYQIKLSLNNIKFYRFFYFFDKIRKIFINKCTKKILIGISVIVIILSVSQWLKKGNISIGVLAPNIVAGLLTLVLKFEGED
jgi:hypothetical protein